MIKKILLALIRGYKVLISPFWVPCCRFYPTCSTYSMQAIEKYSIFKGLYLSVKRILKCHPFHAGGADPLI